MDPPRENNSPSTPSRYLNSYLQQNSTEIFHQNFSQRQLPNQQFYAADNLSTNNKNYLKRHHPSYHNDKTESEREKKYDKYENKKLDEAGSLTHGSFEGFNSDAYAATNIAPTAVAAVTPTPAVPQKAGAKSLSNGKKTKGRVKIKMEYIDNKLRRYTTFSKRKTGIMKKAYELSTLTGTQVMLLVASETGHVYTFATRKLQPMITSEAGKTLIQTCLNSPDIPPNAPTSDQRMSATGFEETELNYSISDLGENPGDKEKVRQLIFNSHQNLPQNTSHLYNLPHAQHFSHSPQSSQHFSHFSPPQHHFPSPHFPQQSFYENQNLQTASPQNYHSLAATAASVAGQSQSHR